MLQISEKNIVADFGRASQKARKQYENIFKKLKQKAKYTNTNAQTIQRKNNSYFFYDFITIQII